MVLRSARCLSAVAVLSVVVTLGGWGPASATAAAPTPSVVLVAQSATVTPAAPGDPAAFQITVRAPGAPAGSELGLVFYEKLTSRSAFDQTLSGRSGNVMQEVAPEPLTSLRPVASGLQLAVTVVAGTAEPNGSTTVGLRGHGGCAVGAGDCSGVYPVGVELLSPEGTLLSRLTTYLVYAEARSARPLVFSWVVPVGAPVHIRAGGTLAEAIPSLGTSRVRDLAALAQTLASNPSVQVTVAPSLSTLQRLEASHTTAAHSILNGLRTVAGSGPGRLLTQPYVPVNLASLAAAGIPAEIEGQTQPATNILAPIVSGLPSADQPSHATWVTDGPVTPAIVMGLTQVRSENLVLPDTDLTSATEEYHASWSQPFSLDLGHTSVRSAAIDTHLSTYFTALPADPVLAANQLLAELAMIQSELPNAPDPRGVVAVPPASWDPKPQFVSALVNGLTNNPVVSTATLNGFFASVPAGGNQAETTRHLASGTNNQRIGRAEAAVIVRARSQIDAFSSSILGSPGVANQLEDLLLTAESNQLRQRAQLAGLAAFGRYLAQELGSIKVVTSSVTLTAQTASIPITIDSNADLHLTTLLTLSSPKLVFPEGSTRTVRVDHPTNSVQVEVRARTTGDLPLTVTLTSPGGALVIAHDRLTVRSTATSVVGIVLTLVAAVVLTGWWARTLWKGRRRRARSAHGTSA